MNDGERETRRESAVVKNSGTLYELRVTGCLPEHWASWFDCGRIEQLPSGETALFVRVPDQPALHGVLRAIGSLGLPLVLLRRVEADGRGATGVAPIG